MASIWYFQNLRYTLTNESATCYFCISDSHLILAANAPTSD